jgi:hypothetical protein
MQQTRKYTLLLSFMVLTMVVGAVLFRQLPATEDWAPLFDIGALLGIVGLSFQWDRAIEPTQTRA